MGEPVGVLAFLPVYNEAGKLSGLLEKFQPGLVDEVLVIDDGSTDGSGAVAGRYPVTVLRNERQRGVGAGIRRAIHYGRGRGHRILVVMAGNGKDDPREIPRLLEPILGAGADYVQGSRFLAEGRYRNLPFFRLVMIKLFTRLVNLATGFRGTDVTNGFRAYRLAIFDHPAMNIEAAWLDTYEMEYYIHYKALTLGFKVREVPVSKLYPAARHRAAYTKIRPFVDWWRMVRPLVFLVLRIKR